MWRQAKSSYTKEEALATKDPIVYCWGKMRQTEEVNEETGEMKGRTKTEEGVKGRGEEPRGRE
jgi:hypothetical protein